MRRRDALLTLLTLGSAILVLPAAPSAFAQPSQKVFRLAILELMGQEAARPLDTAFEKGLRDLGYIEGKNLVIERHFADGRADRLPALAAQIVRNRPDIIFAPMTPNAHAAKAATGSIPIVIALASDPVASGFAASLARPGGNITGTSNIQTDIDPKRIQILKEVIPMVSRVALVHAGDRLAQIQTAAAQQAGTSLGIEIIPVEARQAQDYKKGFTVAKARGVDAIVFTANAQNGGNGRLTIDLAAEYRLPAIYAEPTFADGGGLITYGASSFLLYYRAATFVDKILKGESPATLPIEQPTTFELVLNLKTAKALGIKFPQSILLRADRVIE